MQFNPTKAFKAIISKSHNIVAPPSAKQVSQHIGINDSDKIRLDSVELCVVVQVAINEVVYCTHKVYNTKSGKGL